jgi:hypothetical protein
MHTYRLVRKGAIVEIFVDGRPSSKTVNANLRDELRGFFASCGVPQAETDSKVHELYITDTTSFTSTSQTF